MIQIKNLTKYYDDRAVVDNLSLEIKPGTIVGFLGANGSGKTTTLKMIVGISNPDGGTILIEDKPATDTETKKIIGFMPELPSFYEYLTGSEFLAFCETLSRGDASFTEKRAEEIFKKVGLFEARDVPIRGYSKGMRQRLAFAQAIVHDPSYIFLDEPLDGLDPIGRKAFKQFIKELKSEGKTIFLSSHILFDAEELCDEIAIINKGKLIYTGDIPGFVKGKKLEEQFVETIEKIER
jgi:ABC-2 type transport system ATP-binding protein